MTAEAGRPVPGSRLTSHGHEPLVSVVTPAYNEAQHIEECIESVLAQTYSNWRLTVVDNASSDATPDIVSRYAARDPRIRLLRNPGTVPVLENYNIAMAQLAPEASYCKVVAGDDVLYASCLERMVQLAEAHPGVAIVSSFSLTGRRVDPGEYPFEESVVDGRLVLRSYLATGLPLVGAPTLLLFRADAVRGRVPFFATSAPHADVAACLEIQAAADYGFVPELLTFSRVRDASLTSAANRVNVYLPNMLEFIREYGPSVFSERELDELVRATLGEYYAFLGRERVRGRERAFWEYHRGRLRELGLPLSEVRVLVSALIKGGEYALRRLQRAWPRVPPFSRT